MTRILTPCLVLIVMCVAAVGSRAQATATVFINEIHYDNTGTDAGELIEIAGPAGTNLSGYSIVLYNGANGQTHDTDPLSGLIPDQQNGFGTVRLEYPTNGIQNGAPDGVALVQGTTVIQFLSYEGAFAATDIATADGTATIGDGDYAGRSESAQQITSDAATYTFTVAVRGDLTFESDEQFSVTLSNVSGATVSDGEGIGTITNDDAAPPVTSDVVISQVYGGGGNSGATFKNDFIELFNRGASTVNLAGWSVQYSGATGGTWSVTPISGSIAAGGYYLVQEAAGAGGTTPLPAPNAIGTIAMSATAGKVAVRNSTTAFAGACPTTGGTADLVGYGGANCFEGAQPAPATSNTTAALRKRGGCFDSNNNNTDFSIGSPNPRNSATASRSCDFVPAAIDEIQGNGLATPLLGLDVTTAGIVTGRKNNGFFLQTPDVEEDGTSATSQGIFVFTSSTPAVAVGDGVTARGTASEFFSLTQLESSLPGDYSVDTSGNVLPAAVTLTTTILDPAGTADQLERFEGMRIHADSLISVAPTNEFGEISTVLPGVARPIREPGIEISLPVPPDPTTGVPDCCIPRFDENPERILIDTDGLAGASVISVTSHVTLTDVTGPLDYSFGAYKVLPEALPTTSSNISAVPLPVPAADQFTVAGFNIIFFSNNDTQRRKAALAIRQVLRYPDVIGLIEILDVAALQALATQVNTDAVAAGDPDPAYEARLIPASPSATQNLGFLVKTSRVQIDEVTQEGALETYTNPLDGEPETLHDRPPLVLRATVALPDLSPRSVIVVLNHLRSFIDIELVAGDGRRVRAKRTAQAEFLAGLLQTLQTENPTTPVISIGDYNAYEFNDGFTDPIAIIKGTPTPDDQIVVDESPDLVNPNFINLTDSLPPAERYSFIFEGTPQALDHVIVNSVAQELVRRYAIARSNSDFPEGPLFEGDVTKPERASDHDMPVAYFAVPDTVAPVIADVPADITVEASGPDGRVVSFTTPTATDFDESVEVTCSPASGSLFPIGTSVVTCSAIDVAGNEATATFNVTVTDPRTAGIMVGSGRVPTSAGDLTFTFLVQEGELHERGLLVAQVRQGRRTSWLLALQMTSVFFSDDPQPPSGVDTVEFAGTARWNGASGFTFEARASDHDGAMRRDTFTLTVRDANGAVVLTSTGALQAGAIESIRARR